MRVSTSAEDLIKRNWRTIMLDRLKEILGKVLPEVDMSAVTESTRLVEDLGFDY